MQYYGTRLSENISRREPEGYLLCLNVPVARTGSQDYLPEELGLPSGPGVISVFRTETEVFAPETLASFEGMPVTNDHPPDGVDIENIRRLQMGHAHNVRRGSGEESDLLLADLIITDERLIDAILAGKREISCGYTYELSEENGQYFQRRIRGNHIAVVDAGRAGPRVSIKDQRPTERRNPMKKLSKLLARMAKDGDVETVAEIIGEMIGEEETPAEETAEAVAEAVEAVAEAPAEAVVVEAPEAKEITIDEESVAGILERLDRLIALLTPAAGDEDPAEEIAEIVEEAVEAAAGEPEIPAAEEEIAELIESIVEPEASVTLEETEGDEDPEDPEQPCASDALSAALMAVRPALAKMSRKQRRKVCADIAARFRRRSPNGLDSRYAAVKPAAGGYEALGKRIMASRNANYKH
ncbi:MAG: DUF2213 domain-containing protein [Clostridium sp.]|nr:DUF2213 domain-containing protein [Clostridium sp.]